jgi:hypothetical protein
MKAVVVYESMYGNTHLVADAIAAGIRDAADGDVTVVAVDDADAVTLDGADLVVVGGPTHVHGLSRPKTRTAAAEAARKDGSDLILEPDAEGSGLREWFDELDGLPRAAAAFDTRIDAPPALTGRASKGIGKRLRKHGCALVVDPESFLVTKENHLLAHEADHGREWGRALARAFAAR